MKRTAIVVVLALASLLNGLALPVSSRASHLNNSKPQQQDQPDRPDRFLRVLDPGVLPILDDRERTRDADFQLAQPRERHEAAFAISASQGRGQIGDAGHRQDQPHQGADGERGEAEETAPGNLPGAIDPLMSRGRRN